MTDLINQLMNHEAVYRTDPAIPGLLKTLFSRCIACEGLPHRIVCFCHILKEVLTLLLQNIQEK